MLKQHYDDNQVQYKCSFTVHFMHMYSLQIDANLCASISLSESVTVTDTGYPKCKTYYLTTGEDLDIYYYGASLGGECEIEVDSYGTKEYCVKAVSFDIGSSCQVEVEYFKYTWSSSPEKVLCIRKKCIMQYDQYTVIFSAVYIYLSSFLRKA